MAGTCSIISELPSLTNTAAILVSAPTKVAKIINHFSACFYALFLVEPVFGTGGTSFQFGVRWKRRLIG
jgi:hypothetical protein